MEGDVVLYPIWKAFGFFSLFRTVSDSIIVSSYLSLYYEVHNKMCVFSTPFKSVIKYYSLLLLVIILKFIRDYMGYIL